MHSETCYYHRVRIQGTLTTVSALHIGSGELKEATVLGEAVTYNALCRSQTNQAYLPAATLRGFLAEVGCAVDNALHHRVFGYAEAEAGQAGALRVYDAILSSLGPLPLQPVSPNTALRSYVALNPITGVAEAHQLFNLEYVPTGSVFRCDLELEHVDAQILSYVLELLTYWDGTARSSLGSGASKGRGRVKWNLEQIAVLTDTALQHWLTSEQSLTESYEILSKPLIPAISPITEQQIIFRLYPQAPFLLNDPAYVSARESDVDSSLPALEYSRTPDNHALIPATALRGWMRGRARRILLTLLVANGIDWHSANTQADNLLEPLFGSTRQQSLLWFDDAISPQIVEPHCQMFNGVDRFTGGVANGKLYQVRAAECDYLEGKLYLPKALPAEWCNGLLLLVIRDALEGDLVLGWGKGRGYGSFNLGIRLGTIFVKGWAGLKASLQRRYNIHFGLAALHKQITQINGSDASA